MTGHGDLAFAEALEWAARIQDADFEDWDGHAAWLSSDPGNPARYHHAVLAMDAGLAAVLPTADVRTSSTNDNHAPHGDHRLSVGARRWSRWSAVTGAGIGIAACVAALVVVPRGASAPQMAIRSGPGEVRHLRLPDGTAVALNGDSLLRFDLKDRRSATLERGQAFFEVVHDAARPFELHVGARTFRDVGTAFDARRNDDRVRLSVAEGAVAFDPQGANIRISAGRAIDVRGTTVVMTDAPAAAAGSWRSGRLIFQDAPLTDVADELTQSLGETVVLAPGLGARRFSGILRLGHDHADVVRQLTNILGLKSQPAPQVADHPLKVARKKSIPMKGFSRAR